MLLYSRVAWTVRLSFQSRGGGARNRLLQAHQEPHHSGKAATGQPQKSPSTGATQDKPVPVWLTQNPGHRPLPDPKDELREGSAPSSRKKHTLLLTTIFPNCTRHPGPKRVRERRPYDWVQGPGPPKRAHHPATVLSQEDFTPTLSSTFT